MRRVVRLRLSPLDSIWANETVIAYQYIAIWRPSVGVNLRIHYMNKLPKYWTRLNADLARQWMLLASLQALLSIWLVQQTQSVPSITLLAVVVWGGALICMEDRLDGFQVRPSRISIVSGMVLLACATWRSSVVLGWDATIYGLVLIQGLGLAMLAKPVRQLSIFRDPLFVLSLFPLQLILAKILPEYWFSVVTGKASQLMLLIFGVDSSLDGRILSIGSSSVSIGGPCNGVDLLAQLTVIAVVFVLAFPINSLTGRLVYVIAAAPIAFAMNVFRICILAVINSSDLPNKKQLFYFMHDDWGSLVFAGLATMLIGKIYMAMIDRQLGRENG